MSAQALPPPTNPSDSLYHKLRYTPLRDLLRGRLTETLDLVRLRAETELPAPLAEIVVQTVRKTRLWRSERLDVANELIAHFRDGLASGATAEHLLSTFGNLDASAKLIRRAKKRRRSLLWRSGIKTMQILAGVFAIVVAIYLVLVAYLYSGSVKVKRNFASELNARVLAIPEEQRAWPLYRKAYLALGSWPTGVQGRERPGGPDWHQYVEFAKENGQSLRLYREAAGRPHLGALLFDPDDYTAELKRSDYAPPGTPLEPPDNPRLIGATFNELSFLRDGARLVAIDAMAAVDARDGSTVVQDVKTILQMAEHMAERGAVISALFSSLVVRRAQSVIAYALTTAPDSLTESEWQCVAHLLSRVFGGGPFPLPDASESRSISDVIQRVFTDDGQGDGHIAPSAASWMLDATHFGALERPASPYRSVQVLLPVVSAVHVRRQAFEKIYKDILNRGIQESRTPLWLITEYKVPIEVDAYRSGHWNQLRFGLGAWLFPTLARAGILQQWRTQQRDATLVAIALNLYRKKHGTYPSDLTELVPKFLPSVPPDRYDGKPIKYKLVSGKPLLYSVGADRKDDGGRLPEGSDHGKANRQAYEWWPANDVEVGLREKKIGDGDWILWPPVEE